MGSRDAPLKGAPAVRRQKTHSAESGYVYQYFYEGRRPHPSGGEEFVFQVTADRRTLFPATIVIPTAVLTEWQQDERRELLSKERYAIAKLMLFRAFDERESPDAMRQLIMLDRPLLDEIAEVLGLRGPGKETSE